MATMARRGERYHAAGCWCTARGGPSDGVVSTAGELVPTVAREAWPRAFEAVKQVGKGNTPLPPGLEEFLRNR